MRAEGTAEPRGNDPRTAQPRNPTRTVAAAGAGARSGPAGRARRPRPIGAVGLAESRGNAPKTAPRKNSLPARRSSGRPPNRKPGETSLATGQGGHRQGRAARHRRVPPALYSCNRHPGEINPTTAQGGNLLSRRAAETKAATRNNGHLQGPAARLRRQLPTLYSCLTNSPVSIRPVTIRPRPIMALLAQLAPCRGCRAT